MRYQCWDTKGYQYWDTMGYQCWDTKWYQYWDTEGCQCWDTEGCQCWEPWVKVVNFNIVPIMGPNSAPTIRSHVVLMWSQVLLLPGISAFYLQSIQLQDFKQKVM